MNSGKKNAHFCFEGSDEHVKDTRKGHFQHFSNPQEQVREEIFEGQEKTTN